MVRRDLIGQLARGILVVLLAPVVGIACGPVGGEVGSARIPVSTPRPPVRIAIFVDKSRSVIENDILPPSIDEIAQLVDLLGEVGGELGLGRIDDRSDQSLLRLKVDVPPVAPIRPSDKTNPFILRDAMATYAREFRKHEALFGEWTEKAVAAADEFLARVRPIIDGPPNASSTDIYGAIRRGGLFLAEPLGPVQAEPMRVLILITDGVATVKSEPLTPASGVQLLIVNGNGSAETFAAMGAMRFESSAAAIQYVVETAMTERGGL